MRIDATNAGKDWRAWDARRCFQPALTFADDETHQYGMAHVLLGPDGLPFRIVEVVRQAQRVRILREMKLILINPVDDDELDEEAMLAHGEAFFRARDQVPETKLDVEFPNGLEPIKQSWWRKWPWRRK